MGFFTTLQVCDLRSGIYIVFEDKSSKLKQAEDY